MKLTMLHCNVLMHYAFGVGDKPGIFAPGAQVRDAFQDLLEQGCFALHPHHQSQDAGAQLLTGTYYVLSGKGRDAVNRILQAGISNAESGALENIDADFDKWITQTHGDCRGRKYPLKEVFGSEYKAYCRGRLDEQKPKSE